MTSSWDVFVGSIMIISIWKMSRVIVLYKRSELIKDCQKRERERERKKTKERRLLWADGFRHSGHEVKVGGGGGRFGLAIPAEWSEGERSTGYLWGGQSRPLIWLTWSIHYLCCWSTWPLGPHLIYSASTWKHEQDWVYRFARLLKKSDLTVKNLCGKQWR